MVDGWRHHADSSSGGRRLPRRLGTMIIYGFPEVDLEDELTLAARLGATCLEILPAWAAWPEPDPLRRQVEDRGFSIHSAHGCWGGRTICANRVDLGATDPTVHRESVDDLKRCVDWLAESGGSCLVVHPGGLSEAADSERRHEALARGLRELGDHALTASPSLKICVENMPPGVHPGSRMAELADLIRELDHPRLALALDTGHANLTTDVVTETMAAGSLLATTHVHDNNGRQDAHEPPGHGTIDWPAWGRALDEIAYAGPIMMECIRQLRKDPSLYRPEVLQFIARTD